MKIEIYTDGSCSGNGRKENFGGYSAIAVVNGKLYKTFYKGKQNTTNNEMELMGVLTAVKIAKQVNQEVTIYTDSAYVVNSVNQWMHGWAMKGWVNSKNEPVKNLQIMKELHELLSFDTKIKVVKVKGHSGDYFNEIADRCAVKGTEEIREQYIRRNSSVLEG